MNLIFKFIFKDNLISIIEKIFFILFCIFFSAITMGLTAGPFQITTKSMSVLNNTNKWDYDWKPYWQSYDSNFLFNYFENPNSDEYNSFGENLFSNRRDHFLIENQTGKDDLTILDALQIYYKKANIINSGKSFHEFVGDYIKNYVFSFEDLFYHSFVYPVFITSDNPYDKNPYEVARSRFWRFYKSQVAWFFN